MAAVAAAAVGDPKRAGGRHQKKKNDGMADHSIRTSRNVHKYTLNKRR